jgi:hypothetical protein
MSLLDLANFNPCNIYYGTYFQNPWINQYAQYAIHEMVSDRFIYCSSNHRNLLDLINVFSSRYQLKLVRLDKASNFTNKLIDNTCVTNWTAPDLVNIETSFTHYITNCIDATELTLKDPINTDELIYKDQPYLNYAYNVIELMKNAVNEAQYHLYVDEFSTPAESESRVTFYADMIDQPFIYTHDADLYYHYQKKIYSILYHNFDFVSAKQKIDQLIKELHPEYNE